MTRLSWLGIAPLLIALSSAIVSLCLATRPRRQRAASMAGACVLLLCAVLLMYATSSGQVLEMRFGGWDAPFAIEFRVDAGAALMIALAAVLAVFVLTYTRARAPTPLAHPLIHALLAGAAGAYATADLFNLYVWFEVMFIAALGLVVAGRRRQRLDAGLKYLVLNMFGTVVLLVAVSGLYGVTGQLNFDAIGETLAMRNDPLASMLVALVLVALLIKAGAFPFLFWLPAAYPSLPVPLLALFTAITTKVAAYALLRITGHFLPGGMPEFSTALGWLAVATMIAGVLGAVYHYDVRRILAFHSVSQMGYILLAAALGGAAGRVAALFFIVHHALVKANLYLIAGMIGRSGSYDLRRIGGLCRTQPWLALLFGVTAAALVGFPPLSGFWAKLLILRQGFSQAEFLWTAAALVTSGLTLLSMAKIWTEAFWKPHPEGEPFGKAAQASGSWFASTGLLLVAVSIGLAPAPLLRLIETAVGGLP